MAWHSRTLAGPFHNPMQWSSARQNPGQHPACWLDSQTSAIVSGTEESDESKMARLLAVLFLAKEPFSSRKLSQYSNLADGTEARTLVTRLNRQLDSEGRAFRIESVAGGYQMVTRPKFAKWLRRLEYVPGEVRLSAPAMETLAVVAYRQPVLRAEVESVRGVSCGEILSQLLTRDLIRIGGRSDELGRPYLYNTTKRFLQLFGLRSLEELPRSNIFQDESGDLLKLVDGIDETKTETADKGPCEEN